VNTKRIVVKARRFSCCVLSLMACAVAMWGVIATAHAAPKYGADYLAAEHYEAAMMQAHPPGGVGGVFLRTFPGPDKNYDARPTVEQMACSGKFSEIVVHAAPFDRTHAYPIAKLLPQLKADAAWAQALQQRCGTRIMFSPFCEHNHKAAAMLAVFRPIKEIAPDLPLVNSIWKGERVDGTITEIHLTSSNSLPRPPPGEYTVSFDGFGGDGSGDFTDTDVPGVLAFYRTARHIRLWNFRFNGKFGHKDTTPLAARKHWPSAEYITGHLWMMRERQCPPSWPNNRLAKPFADDHGSGGKDNKLMAILPPQGSAVKVLDRAGNVIDTMQRAATDHTGKPQGARYYSSRYAYQVGNDAQKRGGSRCVRIGNSPPTDVDFRSNFWK
jgi:hypothetical protein